MKVVPGPASTNLGFKISTLLGVPAVPLEFKHFPDGESYIRFTENVAGEETVIVQTTGPPQDHNLLQLLLLADTAKDLGARSIIAVVPYLAYGRQERRYRPGEAVSVQTVFKLLRNVGVDGLITVDFHSPKTLESFGNPFENVSALPSLAQHMLQRNLEGAFSLAPDDGAIEFVEITSKILKGDHGWLEKKRNRVTGEVNVELKALNVQGIDAIIFDDIISTGSTMIHAVKVLKEQGAKRVYSACVHPLLVDNAKEKLLNAGASDIVGTDSVHSDVNVISVAPVIAEALRKWQM